MALRVAIYEFRFYAPKRLPQGILKSPRGPKLTPNQKGEMGKNWSRQYAIARGEDIIGEEVDLIIDVKGTKVGVRADLLTQPKNADFYAYIESKYSSSAPYTPHQQVVIPELVAAGDAGLIAEIGPRSGHMLRAGQKIRVVFQGDVWSRGPTLLGE